MNYLSPLYRAVPIGITVEGASIVTRSLMVFGQGAIRAHAHLLDEILALEEEDTEEALTAFDTHFWRHVGHSLRTMGRSLARSLIEVVTHDKTSAETRNRLVSFCTAIDRLPVAVADRPGFLVNRALMPCLLEALLLMDEGVPKERIDAAALKFGMPMGPVTLERVAAFLIQDSHER